MNKVESTKNPATRDIDFLIKQINQETSEYGKAYPFAFFMRDDAAESSVVGELVDTVSNQSNVRIFSKKILKKKNEKT